MYTTIIVSFEFIDHFFNLIHFSDKNKYHVIYVGYVNFTIIHNKQIVFPLSIIVAFEKYITCYKNVIINFCV